MSIDQTGRSDALAILREVVEARDPTRLVAANIRFQNGVLEINGLNQQIPVKRRLVVLAIGKASVPMAIGALESLGSAVDHAIAVTKSGMFQAHAEVPEVLEVIESDHPVPGRASLEAGERLLEITGDLAAGDVAVVLISGGGSALVEALDGDLSLDDLQSTTDLLLRHGATINQLNAVRRRLSRIKGGKLAREIAPASLVNIVISDVLGSPLKDIASGPTVPPRHDTEDPAAVLRALGVESSVPERVTRHLAQFAPDSISPVENVLGTVIIDDATRAARDAAVAARARGYRVQTLGFDFQGEAREFGRTWATIAKHASRYPDTFSLPLALIGAGETTVTVQGSGAGGRNTEMALAAAREIDGTSGITIASFATDADDGVSGFAGGIVDGATVEVARGFGIDVMEELRENNSAPVLQRCGAAIDIGITGTNVNDLYLALIQPARVPERPCVTTT